MCAHAKMLLQRLPLQRLPLERRSSRCRQASLDNYHQLRFSNSLDGTNPTKEAPFHGDKGPSTLPPCQQCQTSCWQRITGTYVHTRTQKRSHYNTSFVSHSTHHASCRQCGHNTYKMPTSRVRRNFGHFSIPSKHRLAVVRIRSVVRIR